MQHVQIDTADLKRLQRKLEQSPEIIRKAKADAFQQAAPELKQLVDSEIGGSGKVKSWQEAVVGSKGGYAAVRPKAKTYAQVQARRTYAARAPRKQYAVGHVTASVERGHSFPSPSGKNRHYRPRIRVSAMNVAGEDFYAAAREKAHDVAEKATEQVLEAVRRHLTT